MTMCPTSQRWTLTLYTLIYSLFGFQPLVQSSNSALYNINFLLWQVSTWHDTTHLKLFINLLTLLFSIHFTDLHWMGQLLFGACQVKAHSRRPVNGLSRWITSCWSHRGCYHLQSTWLSEKAEDTTANGEFRNFSYEIWGLYGNFVMSVLRKFKGCWFASWDVNWHRKS